MSPSRDLLLNIPIADVNFILIFENPKTHAYFNKRFQSVSDKPKIAKYKLTISETVDNYSLSLFPESFICNIRKTISLEDLYFTIQALIQYSVLKSNILFIHASSMIKDNTALLFMAPSGSGKSTIVKNFPSNKVLSDDITILKKINNKFYVYTSVLDNKYFQGFPLIKSRLGKIFFIKKASFTSINQIGTFEEKLNIILHNNLLFWFIEIQKSKKINFPESVRTKLFKLGLDLVTVSGLEILYLKKDRSFIDLI